MHFLSTRLILVGQVESFVQRFNEINKIPLFYVVTQLLQNMNILLGIVINKSNAQLRELSELRCDLRSLKEELAGLNDSVWRMNSSLQKHSTGPQLQTSIELAQLQGSLNMSIADTVSRLATAINTSFANTQYFLTQQLHTISSTVCSKLKNQTGTGFDLQNQTDTGFDGGYGIDPRNTTSPSNAPNTCGGAGWRRVAYLDMTDPNTTCPSGWKLTDYPKRTCGRLYTQRYTCNPVIFPVSAREYSSVCGRIKAYQYGYTQAIQNSGIDTAYLSGVSITHGYPRTHIWSFGAGKSELDHDSYVCPCEANRNLSISFIGDDYFCESGKHQRWGQRGTPSYILYADDPLWDGKNCLRGICCAFNNPPYFIKKLTKPSTNYIEVRICSRGISTYEDIAIEELELYVK